MTGTPTTGTPTSTTGPRADGDTSPGLLGLLRPEGDRVGVRLERRYPTAPADLWDALTRPERLARWLAPVSGDLRPGGQAVVDFGEGQATPVRVLRCEAPRTLEVTWSFPGEPESRLLAEVSAVGEGSLLVLDHALLPEDQGVGYGAGWHAHLASLADVLAGAEPGAWDDRFTSVLGAYRAVPVREQPGGTVAGTRQAPVISVERVYDTTAEDLWAAWTEPERLARWLTVTEAMTLREQEPYRRLAFDFFEEEYDRGGTVTVTLEPLGDGRTRLRLVHAMATAPGAAEHAPSFGAGWLGFLAGLAARLAGNAEEQARAADEAAWTAYLHAFAAATERLPG
jgi:uncharacterized protein YndB with AHSA1/START domain